MPWQFLSPDDRRQLSSSLEQLDAAWSGVMSRSSMLNQAGLYELLPRLTELADSSARDFTGELIAVLEDGEWVYGEPQTQVLGALLRYVSELQDTPQDIKKLFLTLLVRYQLDDEARLAQWRRELGAGAPQPTPWQAVRRHVADAAPSPPAPAGGGISVGSVSAGNLIIGNDGVMNIANAPRDEPPDDWPAPLRHVRATLRQTRQAIENLPIADEAVRADLIRLVGRLEKALRTTPPGRHAAAVEVADLTQELIAAAGAARPRKAVIQAHGSELTAAAGASVDDLPDMVEYAAKLAAQAAKAID